METKEIIQFHEAKIESLSESFSMAKMKPKLKSKKIDLVQIKNPRTNRYVKIDRSEGLILGHKKSTGPYKGVKIARKRHKRDLTAKEDRL